ncbi:DUF2934 domain-containing protein [Croceibacterium aestuarii]|uniref:DUF2934 domain-containing protein n=1 Tax=Croceibacterium aestuarii TaxID=3064139 RepID=UPI00272E4B5C|nr:DUF2934 domain-containing protein [Croceibacterium sp. D39]
MSSDLDKRIQERAYEIWESEGRPEGRQEEHWQQARAEFADAKAESTAGKRGRAAKVPGQIARASTKPKSSSDKPKGGTKLPNQDRPDEPAGAKSRNDAKRKSAIKSTKARKS